MLIELKLRLHDMDPITEDRSARPTFTVPVEVTLMAPSNESVDFAPSSLYCDPHSCQSYGFWPSTWITGDVVSRTTTTRVAITRLSAN